MKKAILVLFLFLFVSSASAAVYRWVDERGVVNFADELDKVPPAYRNSVEETDIPGIQIPTFSPRVGNGQSGEASMRTPPPIEQTLIREGDFAMILAESLKVGKPQNEAEAESTLASVGIVPKNGWIADYPVTPDIIEELQNSVGGAVDFGKLGMDKAEALRMFQDIIARQGLSVGPDTEGPYAGNESSQDTGGYPRPEVINDYYDDEGPPLVTYYPPPPEYYYLYAWVPYPFRCSGFRFRGFFMLKDFHKNILRNQKWGTMTNHVVDPGTKRIVAIDPRTRAMGRLPNAIANVPRTREVTSPEGKRGASAILRRSQERAPLRSSKPPVTGSASGRQISSYKSSIPTTSGGSSGAVGSPDASPWTGRGQAETNQQGSVNHSETIPASGPNASPLRGSSPEGSHGVGSGSSSMGNGGPTGGGRGRSN